MATTALLKSGLQLRVYPKKLERSVDASSNSCCNFISRTRNTRIYETWFRPLEKRVSCLSKLYHCLEPAVFTGINQELEKSLKTTCEEFIVAITKLVVDQMLSFVTSNCGKTSTVFS